MTTRAPVSVVLWDVGGTLVARRESEGDVVLRALSTAGISPLALRPESVERSRQYRRDALLEWRSPEQEAAGFRKLARLLLDRLTPPATPEQIETVGGILADYFDVYGIVDGMPELLADLKGRGVRQAAVSNWPPSLPHFLAHHGLRQFFDLVISSAEEGVVKPDPALLERALQRLGAAPEEAVYIGDSVALDVAPARTLGMQAIHFDPAGTEPEAEVRTPSDLRGRLLELLRPAG